MTRILCLLRSVVAGHCFAPVILVLSIVGWSPTTTEAATVQSAGFTTMGTFEVVLQEDILANTSGEITVNAPVGPGVMGFAFLSITAGFFDGQQSAVSLLEGTSGFRRYSNPTAADGIVTAAVAWAADAWEDFTSWSTISDPERTAFLDDLLAPGQGVPGLFADNCMTGCTTGDGSGNTGGAGEVSPVPLPAGLPLLLAALGGLVFPWRRDATKMKKGLFAGSTCVACVAFLTPAAASEMADCKYKAKLFGDTATIEVQGGKPVSYNWGSYTASNVTRNGKTIFIDAAKITGLRVGKSGGKPAFGGTWNYQGNSAPVTFVCRK